MCNNECGRPARRSLPTLQSSCLTSRAVTPPPSGSRHPGKKYPKALLVNITLSWNKTIELTDDIVLTFESGRPEQMVLEKSLDYGRTWQPYQFYATDCLDAFTMEPKTVQDLTQHTLLDIICTEGLLTRVCVEVRTKTVRFEIKGPVCTLRWASTPQHGFTLRPAGHHQESAGLLHHHRPESPPLLRPATGATMVDENNLSRYFYAISDIKVQGRCKCNLHANSCVYDKEKLSCECEHNTTGPDCGRCKRNYQGRAWSAGSYLPIPKGTANICIPNNIGPVIRPNVSSLGVANRKE
ncbi:unnamed protein product, partial [Lampetra planeri]